MRQCWIYVTRIKPCKIIINRLENCEPLTITRHCIIFISFLRCSCVWKIILSRNWKFYAHFPYFHIGNCTRKVSLPATIHSKNQIHSNCLRTKSVNRSSAATLIQTVWFPEDKQLYYTSSAVHEILSVMFRFVMHLDSCKWILYERWNNNLLCLVTCIASYESESWLCWSKKIGFQCWILRICCGFSCINVMVKLSVYVEGLVIPRGYLLQ